MSDFYFYDASFMWCYSFHTLVCLAPLAESRLSLLVFTVIILSYAERVVFEQSVFFCGQIYDLLSFQVLQTVSKRVLERGQNEVPKVSPKVSGQAAFHTPVSMCPP